MRNGSAEHISTTVTKPYVLDFSQVGAGDVALVGGKCASLGELFRELTTQGVRAVDGARPRSAEERAGRGRPLLDPVPNPVWSKNQQREHAEQHEQHARRDSSRCLPGRRARGWRGHASPARLG